MSKERWNILLDFDKTIAGGHSHGRDFTATSPMDETNIDVFRKQLSSWFEAGHRVAIITRAIDKNIFDYLRGDYVDLYTTTAIDMVQNGYKSGSLSIYAPNDTSFNSSDSTTFWANTKTKYVADFLNKSDTNNPDGISHSIFMDDTIPNVQAMQLAFPTMVCQAAEPGNYTKTFAFVNKTIGMSGGRRKKNKRTKTKRQKSKSKRNATKRRRC
jgi:hypothetical protein